VVGLSWREVIWACEASAVGDVGEWQMLRWWLCFASGGRR
jgi:hypothetical protein